MLILPPRHLVHVFQATWEKFGKDQVGDLAAALTYYALLSLFPLLLLLIIGASLIYQPEAARQTVFTWVSGFAPGATADVLSNTVAEALAKRGATTLVATIVGFVGLLFGSSGVFGILDKSINRVWGCPYQPSLIRDKLISFVLLLGVGAVLVASLIIAAVLNLAESTSDYMAVQVFGGKPSATAWLFQILSLVVTIALNTGILIVIYRTLPRCKVRVRDVWFGALLTAVSWEILKQAFAFYLGLSTSNASIYGSLGAFFLLITWIWLTCMLLLLGAEFSAAYAREREGLETRKRERARRAAMIDMRRRTMRIWRGDPPAPATGDTDSGAAAPPAPPGGEYAPPATSARVVGVAALAGMSLGLLLRGARALTNHRE